MTDTLLTVNVNHPDSGSPLTPPPSCAPSRIEDDGSSEEPHLIPGRYKLRSLLANDQDFDDAQSAPAGFFDLSLQRRLASLYQTHVDEEASSEHGHSSEHGNSTETRHNATHINPYHIAVEVGKGKGKAKSSVNTQRSNQAETPAKKSAYDPWRRFRKLDIISLDPWIQQHLELYGSDPYKFLDDKHPLVIDAESLEGSRTCDVFGACFEYTRQLERRNACDEFRWLFMMLLFHDIGVAINPDSRAERSPGRFGKQMAEKAVKLFARAFESDGLDVDLEDLKANLTKWSCVGRKLAYFCQQFGAGSLFFFRQHLKEHFLNKEISFSGKSFDLGHNHLISLGLRQKAEDSGADELASNIRHLTSRSFQQAAGIRGTDVGE